MASGVTPSGEKGVPSSSTNVKINTLKTFVQSWKPPFAKNKINPPAGSKVDKLDELRSSVKRPDPPDDHDLLSLFARFKKGVQDFSGIFLGEVKATEIPSSILNARGFQVLSQALGASDPTVEVKKVDFIIQSYIARECLARFINSSSREWDMSKTSTVLADAIGMLCHEMAIKTQNDQFIEMWKDITCKAIALETSPPSQDLEEFSKQVVDQLQALLPKRPDENKHLSWASQFRLYVCAPALRFAKSVGDNVNGVSFNWYYPDDGKPVAFNKATMRPVPGSGIEKGSSELVMLVIWPEVVRDNLPGAGDGKIRLTTAEVLLVSEQQP